MNFCLWLLRKEKREYLPNLNDKDINDKTKFWKNSFHWHWHKFTFL